MAIDTGGPSAAPEGSDSVLDLGRARAATEIVGAALRLYGRYPVLFLVLAGGVVLPYDLVVLASTHVGPLGHRHLSDETSWLLELVDTALVSPLISALHIHAVRLAGEGERPRLSRVARLGFRVVPVVAATEIMQWLGYTVGLLLLIVPGVVLLFRWFVAPQAAAIDRGGWLQALRRSRQLTAGQYGHIFGFMILVSLLVAVPWVLGDIVVTGHDTRALAFAGGTALHTFTASIAALTTAVLYYDLVARYTAPPARPMREWERPRDLD